MSLPFWSIFFLPFTALANPGLEAVPVEVQYHLQIEPEEFKKDLLCLVRKYHSPEDFAERMTQTKNYISSIEWAIQDWQMTSEDFSYLDPVPSEEKKSLKDLANSLSSRLEKALTLKLYNSVFRFHFTHSSPLINANSIVRSDALLLEQLMDNYKNFTSFYETDERKDETTGAIIRPSSLTLAAASRITTDPIPNTLAQFQEKGKYSGDHFEQDTREYIDPKPSMVAFLQSSHFADPFVEFLVTQKRESVSLLELVEKLLPAYNNDVLTTLGVIGYAFERERKSVCAYYRSALCFLNSRMKPLITPGESISSTSSYESRDEKFDDPIGYNYHFWGFLNAGLQGFVGLDLGSYQNEIAQRPWAPDYGDYIADVLGFKAGRFIYENIANTNIKCH